VTSIANGGGDLDWSSLVAGPRLAAGLSPFTGVSFLPRLIFYFAFHSDKIFPRMQRKEHPHDTGFGAKSNETKGNLEPESVGGIKEVKNF